MATVAIAIGSNLGDRAAHIEFAKVRLALILANPRFSSVHDTDPVGTPDRRMRFLNAAAAGQTSLAPEALLDALLEIERARGRARPYPLAPRTLDLDLILYGDRVIDAARLTVPHPRFRERAFVLDPLAEIVPEAIDPVTGTSIGALARAVHRRSGG